MSLLSVVEVIGTLTGIISIYCNTQQKAEGWILGIISILAYLFVFWEVFLFADFLLHVIYLIMSIYGYYHWLYGNPEKQAECRKLPVTKAPAIELFILIFLSIISTWISGFLMQKYVPKNTFPYTDAFITSFSLAGTWLTTQKRIENWIIWFITDIVCIYLYLQKRLILTAVLYGIYTILAMYGYLKWKKSLKYNLKN
ncbi:MAG: nicotinamide riboside transporter PnuC [Cytophagales bacterium]|nr:nicotinamide riboside transporter PnuC [Cytophagales bacterium]MDW8385113.1 nicotinamide riboside transporter PnuC [Flammeovirgaceae bacterium]